jgi:nucleoside-diphosphate-sugar epimerase
MLIGNGLMSSAFADYQYIDGIVIFAAGVSNSLEINEDPYKREKELLEKTIKENIDKTIVYFSSVYQPDKRKELYMLHKSHMENIIESIARKYIILRLPQVIGHGGNSNILINYISDKLKRDEVIDVYENTYRSLIDVEDIEKIIYTLRYVERNYGIYTLNSIEELKVNEIVDLVAVQLNKIPKINLISKPITDNIQPYSHQAVNSLVFKALLDYLKIRPIGYTESIIKKYVS